MQEWRGFSGGQKGREELRASTHRLSHGGPSHNWSWREDSLAYESSGVVATRNSEGVLVTRTVGATDLSSVSRLVKFTCRCREAL
jgi:hypothetical protein